MNLTNLADHLLGKSLIAINLLSGLRIYLQKRLL